MMSEKWFELHYWQDMITYAVIVFLAIAAIGIFVVGEIREAIKRHKKKKDGDR